MKNYKCIKAWSRHGVGTVINEWEFTRLPINIKANHFILIQPVVESPKITVEPNPVPFTAEPFMGFSVEPPKANPFKRPKVETKDDIRPAE